MANSLFREKSVYLQQHAHNPVNWFPWGKEAFAKAKAENKPLFVSIGYSTCHWCHVMEQESFEDEGVAKLLNEHFVSVKVDREEHPDVDEFFMAALQVITQRGGWPLNMFVTPDLWPFFGGTYFPRETFKNVMTQIQKLWREEPERVSAQARELLNHISGGHALDVKTPATEKNELLAKKSIWENHLLETRVKDFAAVWGGFGGAPKFPRSHELNALLRAALRVDDPDRRSHALSTVTHTLKAMAYGGLRDHLRGGFHRYSTDEKWLVPHFEKMLYDQALLIQSYSEAYRVFREDFYADIVEEISDYLEAEMRLSSGGFAAAQDADSEGVEGKFYVWTKPEIQRVFGDEPAALTERFCALHSVLSAGNWDGQNVLATPLETAWRDWAAPEMKRLRKKLLSARSVRVPPTRDPKVIVAWNAWMATGLLHASMNLADRPQLSRKLLERAERTMAYLVSVAGNDRSLPRVIYGDERKGRGYLEDYGAVIEALQLWGMRSGDSTHFRVAGQLLAKAEALFRGTEGALRSRQWEQNPELPFDKLEFHDGATPAPLSVYVGATLRQALFESDPRGLARALQDIAPLERVLDQYPVGLTHLLCELDALSAIVVKSPKGRFAEVLAGWAGRAELSGQVLFGESETDRFQACDFGSCFANDASLSKVWPVSGRRST